MLLINMNIDKEYMEYLKRQPNYNVHEYSAASTAYNKSKSLVSDYMSASNIDYMSAEYIKLNFDMKKYVQDRIDKDKRS